MPAQRIPASAWRARVGQMRASGLSIECYAQQLSYPVDRLRYWAQRLGREEQAAPFVPIRVRSPAPLTAIEVRGPSGWSMRPGIRR